MAPERDNSLVEDDWEHRVLCSDESCIGVIGPDGRCKECGLAYEGDLPWLADTGWLAGDGPTLAEAVIVPFYVRLDGLRRLGFDHPLPPGVEAHRRRCAALAGWPAVAWTADQTDELVGRFEAHRRRARAAV